MWDETLWQGLGSALVGALATAVTTIFAVTYTLRHERRKQSADGLEAELRRLLDDLRFLRQQIIQIQVVPAKAYTTFTSMQRWIRQARRIVPAVRREHNQDVALLLRYLLDDAAEETSARGAAYERLEAYLTWVALTPEQLTSSRLKELHTRRGRGLVFD